MHNPDGEDHGYQHTLENLLEEDFALGTTGSARSYHIRLDVHYYINVNAHSEHKALNKAKGMFAQFLEREHVYFNHVELDGAKIERLKAPGDISGEYLEAL